MVSDRPETYYITQAGLKFTRILPSLPMWDNTYDLPYLGLGFFYSDCFGLYSQP